MSVDGFNSIIEGIDDKISELEDRIIKPPNLKSREKTDLKTE